MAITLPNRERLEAIRLKAFATWRTERGWKPPIWISDAGVFRALFLELATETDAHIGRRFAQRFGGSAWQWGDRARLMRSFLELRVDAYGLTHEPQADGTASLRPSVASMDIAALHERVATEYEKQAGYTRGGYPRVLADPELFAFFYTTATDASIVETAEEMEIRFDGVRGLDHQTLSRIWRHIEAHGLQPEGVTHRRRGRFTGTTQRNTRYRGPRGRAQRRREVILRGIGAVATAAFGRTPPRVASEAFPGSIVDAARRAGLFDRSEA